MLHGPAKPTDTFNFRAFGKKGLPNRVFKEALLVILSRHSFGLGWMTSAFSAQPLSAKFIQCLGETVGRQRGCHFCSTSALVFCQLLRIVSSAGFQVFRMSSLSIITSVEKQFSRTSALLAFRSLNHQCGGMSARVTSSLRDVNSVGRRHFYNSHFHFIYYS